MKADDIRTILAALNDAEVRYLIVGGLAVVAHGYVRFTQDLDMVIQLKQDNILRAMGALTAIGYRPLIPVEAVQFADEQLRAQWIREKGMIVFQMLDPHRESTRVDIFVEEPFVFDQEYSVARKDDVFGVAAPVVSLDQLLALKRRAGRPSDLADIDQLQQIAARKPNG